MSKRSRANKRARTAGGKKQRVATVRSASRTRVRTGAEILADIQLKAKALKEKKLTGPVTMQHRKHPSKRNTKPRKYMTPLTHKQYVIEPCPACGFPEADGGFCPDCGWTMWPGRAGR